MRLRVTSRVVDDERQLLDVVPVGDPLVWLCRGEGLVGWGATARIEPGAGPDRFASAHRALAGLAADATVEDEVGAAGSGLVAFGSFTFDDATVGSRLVVPRLVVGRRDGVTWLTRITTAGEDAAVPDPALRPLPAPRRDRPRYAGSSKPDLHWLEAVAAGLERIDGGALDKVVLGRDLDVWSREPFDALDLARRLVRRFPSCFTFVMEGLVGATPELLLARRGGRIGSRVLAGTTGRSDDEAEDAALGAALLASDKDRREHRLAATSVHEVLAPLSRDLVCDPEPRLLRLDNVQHLATTFEGRLDEPLSALELVAALHPTAAVGGTPRAAALATIAALEGMDRGRYAGPVGWTDGDGDGEWGIALRCAELAGARARLFAGVGVVAGSLPEAELEETRLKLLAMQAVLGEGL